MKINYFMFLVIFIIFLLLMSFMMVILLNLLFVFLLFAVVDFVVVDVEIDLFVGGFVDFVGNIVDFVEYIDCFGVNIEHSTDYFIFLFLVDFFVNYFV